MNKTPSRLSFAILAFVSFAFAAGHVRAENASANEKDCCPGAFSAKDRRRIKARIAELIGCRKKLKKRDAALAKITFTVGAYTKRDRELSKKLNLYGRQRDQARRERLKAERELRKAWRIFWGVTGTITVIAIGTVIVVAVVK